MINVACTVEVLRIARVNSTKINFINHCSTLISSVINKEGNINPISKALSKKNFLVDTFKLLVSSLQNH